MSLPWLTINENLLNGVSLMNSLTVNKFTLMLKHIIQSKGDDIFTKDELEKLHETLKLNDSNLQLLILSIAHLWKQSLKVILKPTVLQEQLVDVLKLDIEKAEQFVTIWTNKTKQDFDLENSKTLDNIAWQINVECASSNSKKQAHPNVRLQLNLSDVDNSNKKENLTLELDEEELLHFYGILENVQSKIDSLH